MKVAWTSAGGVVVAVVALALAVGLFGRPVEAAHAAPLSSTGRASGYLGPLERSGLACCVAATGACEPAARPCEPERIVVWCDPGERPHMVETGVWLCE